MDRKVARVLVFLIGAFVFALVSPSAVEACSCDGWPPCSGTYCWCECNFCSDAWPPMYPCRDALSFNASEDELAAFKKQIDVWSEREDLRTVVEAATQLYESVLFRDSQGFVDASDNFRKVINSLSREARKNLIQPERR